MESKKLSFWPNWKKSLKTLWPKYPELKDIIVFGSTVKQKSKPKDLDLALIVKKKNFSIIGDIKKSIDFKNLDVEMLLPEEVYQSRLGLTLILEGYSLRKEAFLKDLLGIKPYKIYLYEIKHLSPSQKVAFSRGLNLLLKQTKSVKLGAGNIMSPIENSGKVEDFLHTWSLKYTTKEYHMF